MPILTIDGLEVDVQLGSGTEETEDLTRQAVRFDGEVSTRVVNGRPHARRWALDTGLDMATADLDELEARLMRPEPVTVAGDLIGGSVVCEARNVSRSEGPVDLARITAELVEMDP